MTFLEIIKTEASNTSMTEVIAVILGIGYLILIAQKNRLGWWLAFVSSSLYVILSYQVQLYLASGLQMFYVVMAIYGWIVWNKPQKKEDFIIRWKLKNHLLVFFTSTIIALILGYFMHLYSLQATPYLDAFTTVFSLTVTFMTVHKVLENWLYWIAIDSALILLYAQQGLYLVSLNYLIYTIIAIFAFISWKKAYQKQKE